MRSEEIIRLVLPTKGMRSNVGLIVPCLALLSKQFNDHFPKFKVCLNRSILNKLLGAPI